LLIRAPPNNAPAKKKYERSLNPFVKNLIALDVVLESSSGGSQMNWSYGGSSTLNIFLYFVKKLV